MLLVSGCNVYFFIISAEAGFLLFLFLVLEFFHSIEAPCAFSNGFSYGFLLCRGGVPSVLVLCGWILVVLGGFSGPFNRKTPLVCHFVDCIHTLIASTGCACFYCLERGNGGLATSILAISGPRLLFYSG